MTGVALRVAMLSVHSCPLGRLGARDTGGMSVYITEVARELGELGCSVDVFTRSHGPYHGPVVELGKNARLIHLPAGNDSQMDKLAIYPHLPDFARRMERFRRENGLEYDIIYSHYWLSAWVGSHIQRRWRIPHAVMFHTLGAVKNALGIGEDEPELRIDTERSLVRSAQMVISPSEIEKEALISRYGACPSSLRVIPCGVNLTRFRPVDKESARRRLGLDGGKAVLFVGRIEPLKGIDRLLAAVSKLREQVRLKLIIIGGDERSRAELQRLKSVCRSLNIADRVTFTGRVEQAELPIYYSAADVCVVPSFYESFGLVGLESLACGTPVVAADVGGMRTVIKDGENGYLLPDNSPARLAEGISLSLGRKAGWADIRETVSRHSWSRTAAGVAEELGRLAAFHKAQRSLV